MQWPLLSNGYILRVDVWNAGKEQAEEREKEGREKHRQCSKWSLDLDDEQVNAGAPYL
jgi:hypothetical protein